jgi:nucleoside-diphosphate-sugar epimerase
MVNHILVTGANGFLGSNIFKELSTDSIKSLGRRNCDYNIDLVRSIPIFDSSFDLVIHCAGAAHFMQKNDIEDNIFFNVNVIGTTNLLKGLAKSNIPKYFVFISSVSVYGLSYGVNITEDCQLLAKDSYGLSKVETELLVRNWCEENNVVCTILRLPLIVGSNPPGNLGAMINGIQKGYYFNIAGGKARRSMVLAEDVAKSILSVSVMGGIYNLTDGYHPSFAELSTHISSQLGKWNPISMPLWIARQLAQFGDICGSIIPLNTEKLKKITANLTFSDTKARDSFGWNPTSILEGFKLINYDK